VNCPFFSYSFAFLFFFLISSSQILLITDNRRQSIHETPINQANGPILVVIDPGHGGKDQGCSAHSNEEKSFTLPFALKLGDKIQYHSKNAVEVLFTRVQDISISLSKRTEIANAAKADLFISVHANSIHDPSVHGFETYVYGDYNANELPQSSSPQETQNSLQDNITDHILSGLSKSNLQRESILLAETINGRMERSTKLKNRGVKQAQFRVLKDAKMPSVLLEMGYLTSAKDASLLLSDQGQNLYADKIAKAILEYLKVL